jgi:molecular chaperone Hsp33
VAAADFTRKFVFEQADIRGEYARLDDAYRQILEIHQYAPSVGSLIGEFLAAGVLLSTTIKFEGRLVLQAESEGEIPLIMAECTSDQQVRAIARGAEQATSSDFSRLLRNGRLAITIEPDQGQRYQGIVPLNGVSLSACIEHYFQHSEQLPTRLWLASDKHRAAGLLLQLLPAQRVHDGETRSRLWEHTLTLADTVTSGELLELEHERLLSRLFHEDPLKLFPAESAGFACSCSRQRCLTALAAISATELEEILVEQGQISMDCEFCNQQYRFDRDDLGPQLAWEEPQSLH